MQDCPKPGEPESYAERFLRSVFPGSYKAGALSGERYTSKNFFEMEWENVWTKTWQVAGRTTEIPESGDFFTFELGPESFLIVRQADGSVRAFYNVCQHRGNRLVQAPEGSMPSFTCDYHNWRWGIDGALLFATPACRQANAAYTHLRDSMEKLGLPFLLLDMDISDPRGYSPEQVRTRIEGFVEVLEQKSRTR